MRTIAILAPTPPRCDLLLVVMYRRQCLSVMKPSNASTQCDFDFLSQKCVVVPENVADEVDAAICRKYSVIRLDL